MNEKALKKIDTEKSNDKTRRIDRKSTIEILHLINEADSFVHKAVAKSITSIEEFVNSVVNSFLNGGRLIYVGAGTSGRLAVVDAAECPPTYNTPEDMVIALMAGGQDAFVLPVEFAEDDKDQGAKEIRDINVSSKDTVLGIAASGRTPYVIGALEEAKKAKAKVGAFSCSKNAPIFNNADHIIHVGVGPEVVAGSTRMKAGTAQKLVLNMISTTAMIKIGKVYDNLMVDVQVKNEKLKERAIQLVLKITNAERPIVIKTLEKCDMNVKLTCVVLMKKITVSEAKDMLKRNNNFLYKIIDD